MNTSNQAVLLPSGCVWRGRYEAVEREADALRQPYQGLARLLNCDAEEVAILQSATAAWTQARRCLRPIPRWFAGAFSGRLVLDCGSGTLLPLQHTLRTWKVCMQIALTHAKVLKMSWGLMTHAHRCFTAWSSSRATAS